MSKIVQISSANQLDELVSKNRVVVIDFFATWCAPCRAIAPILEKLADQLSETGKMVFVKVDTDINSDITQAFNVTAMPTFVICKNGDEAERVQGADPNKLDKVVRKLYAESGVDVIGGG